jgi:hypothetical protein
LLFQVVRIEAGWAPRAGRVGVVLDVTRAWWPML